VDLWLKLRKKLELKSQPETVFYKHKHFFEIKTEYINPRYIPCLENLRANNLTLKKKKIMTWGKSCQGMFLAVLTTLLVQFT